MKSHLKFITCGSVDDGKSTLIGHMLYDAKLLFTDQEKALELNSNLGSQQGSLDYSLLLDGLMAEREQGITIDVAYRYFTTEKRSFIVADCPGHEQYTRNMAVGASFADLAVILVDVNNGVSQQTRRHIRICTLMGIRNFVLAVNKIDLVDYDYERFNQVSEEFMACLDMRKISNLLIVPVSALEGDNITEPSRRTPWYEGPSLLQYLEEVDIDQDASTSSFVMPVQRVSRPNPDFRGFQGQIESGEVFPEKNLVVLPERESVKVDQVLVAGSASETAIVGQAVTVTLDREVDVSRGSVLVEDADSVEVSDRITATLLWMDNAPLVQGRGYLFKCGTKTISGTIVRIKHSVEIETGRHVPSKKVFKNEIASCEIALSEKIVLAPYEKSRELGGFILIDRVTNATSAAGVIEGTLKHLDNVTWHETDITPEVRAGQKVQTPEVIWFTGLSGSGKSTLANELEKKLVAQGRHTMLLDGDNVRHGLCNDLDFAEHDRVENIRRVAEVAKLMKDAGLITITSFISPYEEDRQKARSIIGDGFIEVYVSTDLDECERRDVKGLYEKARSGKIQNFTGIDSPYQVPLNPDIIIDTTGRSIDECSDELLKKIMKV